MIAILRKFSKSSFKMFPCNSSLQIFPLEVHYCKHNNSFYFFLYFLQTIDNFLPQNFTEIVAGSFSKPLLLIHYKWRQNTSKSCHNKHWWSSFSVFYQNYCCFYSEIAQPNFYGICPKRTHTSMSKNHSITIKPMMQFFITKPIEWLYMAMVRSLVPS